MAWARSASRGRCPSAGAGAGGPGLGPAGCRRPPAGRRRWPPPRRRPSVNRRDPVQVRVGRGDGGDRPVGGDLAGHPGGPGAEQDRAGARAAAGVQDRGEPAGRARPGAAISVTPGPRRARRRAVTGQVAVVRAAEPGQGELEGFQFAEGGVQPWRGRPGRGSSARPAPGSSRAASAAGMITAGSPVSPGGAWASRAARIARAAGSAPGPVRPRPPRAAMSMSTAASAVVAADADRDRAGRQLAPGGVRRSPSAGALPGSGPGAAALVAVRVRLGAGLVQVGVRVFGVRSSPSGLSRAASGPGSGRRWRGAGGAAQGADDLGQRRRLRCQRAGRAGAGAVAAPPLDGRQRERGGDHDRDADPDQGTRRQPDGDAARVRAAGGAAGGRRRPRARGPRGRPRRPARTAGRAGATARLSGRAAGTALGSGRRRGSWSRGGRGAGREHDAFRPAGGSAAPSRG